MVAIEWAIFKNRSTTTRIAFMAPSSGSLVMKFMVIESQILRGAGSGSGSPTVFDRKGLVL